MERAKTDLSSFDNRWYSPGKGLATRVAWFVLGHVFIDSYLPTPMAFKRFLLRSFGARLGRGVVIKPKVNIKHPWLLTVGDHAWIGENVWIDNLTDVVIGDHCCLSQGAMLLTGNHDYKKPSFDLQVRPIAIESGAWVGAKAIVCPGVTVATHAVIAVGSVVQKPTEAYAIYQGNPAVKVRERELQS